MQKNRAIMLEKTAEAIAYAFSIKHREHNYLGESFKVEELHRVEKENFSLNFE